VPSPLLKAMATETETPVLEHAIPHHLRTKRTVPASLKDEFQPPYPTFVGRFPQEMKDFAVAIIGVQRFDADKADHSKLQEILRFVRTDSKECRPRHFDVASVTDPAGAYNEAVLAYWDNSTSFREWKQLSGFDKWWQELDPRSDSVGWFQEVFLPSVDRYETVFTDLLEGKGPEACGTMAESLSGPVVEHGYWGSMRDRLPIAQTDTLERSSTDEVLTKPKDIQLSRVRVPGQENLTLIRSGQDWSATKPEERKLYLDEMHPVLTKGMDFLRDEGGEVGCYSCRLMNVLDSESLSGETDMTFGLAYFDNLASLEKWSKEHPTHLAIFGGFFKYVKRLNFDISLHLYHEVLVLKKEQQFFEYAGCHPGTGMLNRLK
jgi:hypothetical protein